MTTERPGGLGRIHAPDERDAHFPMTSVLPEQVPLPRYHYWNDSGWWGDQGQTPECVAYGWLHWVADGPVVHRALPKPFIDPDVMYREAQDNDEWPGHDYDGTSARGGVKALVQRGIVESYHWAETIDDIIRAVMLVGPVVVGTNWYDDMFQPDDNSYLNIGGELAGGHCYVLNGANTERKFFRMKNSWGRGWGLDGHARLRFDDMERLLNEDGEAVLAIETRKVLRP